MYIEACSHHPLLHSTMADKPMPAEIRQDVSKDNDQCISNTVDPRAESKLVWKFDLRILPVLAVMYLFNSLDKSNLGNSKTAGLEGIQFICIHYIEDYAKLDRYPQLEKQPV